MTNLDCLEFSFDKNGKRQWAAIIDYKEGVVKTISTKYEAIKAQAQLADQLNIPMFIALCYLDDTLYPVPMYRVYCVNPLAVLLFQQTGKNPDGQWMTVYAYSKFQHYLRRERASEQEIGHLSKAVQHYEVPTWENTLHAVRASSASTLVPNSTITMEDIFHPMEEPTTLKDRLHIIRDQNKKEKKQ